MIGQVPPGHPERLAICLWDFSWYTAAAPGQAYENLEAAVSDTKARGFNTIRICAAPLLLFGDLGLDSLATDLEIEGLGTAPTGEHYGRRTRWYDCPGGYSVNLLERFFRLLELAQAAGLSLILSSWEYQQSPAFAADPAWCERIHSVPSPDRLSVLAAAWQRLLDAVDQRGLLGVVAFTELHNEVDFSLLEANLNQVESALSLLERAYPEQLFTVSYGRPPHLDMQSLSDALPIGQFHIYAYGVLDALQRQIDIRQDASAGFPNDNLRALLFPDAPTVAEYGWPETWKTAATVISTQMIYGYDWIDPELWDRWLYNNYGLFRHLMFKEIDSRLRSISAWATRRNVPFVIGEGWLGYTPLLGEFEDGPVGRELAEYGMKRAFELGAWGVVPNSNAAPHHPAWANAEWLVRVNEGIGKNTGADSGIA